jgi:hypothetical protein
LTSQVRFYYNDSFFFGSFKDALSVSDYTTSNDWTIGEYELTIAIRVMSRNFREGFEESQDSLCPDRDSNLAFPNSS